MKNRSFVAATLLAALLITGCTMDIPPKISVRDVGSGKSYTTYESWSKLDKGVGYQFTDIETGKQVTLTNYELKTLEDRKSVPSDGKEAREFNEAKARGGVK